MNRFAQKLAEHSLPLRHKKTEILQINVGKLCNQTCTHCHVDAGPTRTEIMTRETVDSVLDVLRRQPQLRTVDITEISGVSFMLQPPQRRSRSGPQRPTSGAGRS